MDDEIRFHIIGFTGVDRARDRKPLGRSVSSRVFRDPLDPLDPVDPVDPVDPG